MKRVFTLMVALLMGYALYAQKAVTGTVIGEDYGGPLPGANVVIKGTSQGTITDLDGKFSLNVPDGATLLFKFVGFVPQEVVVGEQTDISVTLKPDQQSLEEVVVVGYGVQKKKLVTGATTQMKGEDVAKMNTTSALQAMQGQTPGVNISSTSGQPGEGMKVTIRGAGTIGDASPLYIVDGVQTGDIAYLNSSDIESIDVLKDAASAAIYGSQAANGVVLITTKTGRQGKAKLTFDTYRGFQKATRQISMLNATEYATIMNEAAVNTGKKPYFSAEQIAAMGEGTDWIDQMLVDDAITQNYAVGLSGGNATSVYSMGASYTGQEGIVGGPKASNYDRYTFRLNSDHKLFEGMVKVGQHLTFNYTKKNGIGVGDQYNNSLRSAFNTSPLLPAYDDAGNYVNSASGDTTVMVNGQPYQAWSNKEGNPYASMMYNNQSDNHSQKLFGDVYVELNPIKNLTFKSRYGVDFYNEAKRSFKPVYELSIYSFNLKDQASQSQSQSFSWTWDNFATYDLGIGEHDLSFMVGMSAYKSTGRWLNISNTNLYQSDLNHAYITNTDRTSFDNLSYNGGPNDEAMLASYFGRFSYNLKETYMFNATMRADGSSKFYKDNRWGYFPSMSAGWVISNEDFAQGLSGFANFFKLRGSWGQVGNQKIDAYQYMAPIDIGMSNYYFGSEMYNVAGNTPGAYPKRLANLNVIWETSEQTNVGVDARFLNSRLSANFDYYIKKTKDWLLKKPGYATDGADPAYFNGGEVQNSGIELMLTWRDNIGELYYTLSANVAKNKNEVLNVPTEDGIVHGKTNMLYDNSEEFYHLAETGHPVGYFWGWKTDGIFQNEAEVTNYVSAGGAQIQPNAAPGDVKYVDLNGDGNIDDLDKTELGDPNPDYTFGLSLSLEYKGFDFGVVANGVAGNQIVQSYRNQTSSLTNYTTRILDRWHGEGTSNETPRVTETNTNWQFSDLYVQDGDFLRISNITLGYDLNKLFDQKMFGKFRVYASAQNMFTFTKYDGMDPEIGYGVENGSSGIDIGYYPRAKTYMFGVSVEF